VIELDRFSKRYGDRAAVAELSFTVSPGDILGLVGPNGAGKTTTLRAIAGVLRPGGGTIRVGGFDVVNHVEIGFRIALPHGLVHFRRRLLRISMTAEIDGENPKSGALQRLEDGQPVRVRGTRVVQQQRDGALPRHVLRVPKGEDLLAVRRGEHESLGSWLGLGTARHRAQHEAEQNRSAAEMAHRTSFPSCDHSESRPERANRWPETRTAGAGGRPFSRNAKPIFSRGRSS
jgi:energy-coupling factor transporter ATP-binding protein EcfA2